MHAPLPEGERGQWIDGIDPDTGQRERCTVATVPIWSNGRHGRKRAGRDLEYIAAMHPGVGLALAELLEARAWIVENDPGAFGTSTDTHTLSIAALITAGRDA